MAWLYILLFIPHITATRWRDELGYRSNVMPGNKPILLLLTKAKDYSEFNSGHPAAPRVSLHSFQHDGHLAMVSPSTMSIDRHSLEEGGRARKLKNTLSEIIKCFLGKKKPIFDPKGFTNEKRTARQGTEDSDSSEDRQTGPPSQTKVPEWKHRRIFNWIKSLLNHLPEYPNSQLQMLRNKVPNGFNEDYNPVRRTPSKNNDDFVSSFNENDKPVLRLPSNHNDDFDLESSKRIKAKHKNKKKEKGKLREKPKPDWVINLKDFVKDLTNHYGLEEVLQRAKPVIRSIEKKQRVKVKDVDVDEYGEIHVTYIEKKKNKKKAGRQGNIADET